MKTDYKATLQSYLLIMQMSRKMVRNFQMTRDEVFKTSKEMGIYVERLESKELTDEEQELLQQVKWEKTYFLHDAADLEVI